MKQIFTVVAMVALSITAKAQDKVFVTDGVAINGYDAVAYFTEGKPVQGKESLTLKWNNANWQFASKENLQKFKSNPEEYAPQFGGYCAFGMSQGHKAKTEPNAFTVVNGKLYLNYNLQVKVEWSKDRDNLIGIAEKNWNQQKNK